MADTIGQESAKPGPVALVPGIIAGFTSQMESIAECAKVHIAHAQQTQKQRIHEFLTSIDETITVDATVVATVGGMNLKFESVEQYHSFRSFVSTSPDVFGGSHSDVLSKSLLIFGFSAFDAFLGAIVRATFRLNPQLIYKLEEKTVLVSDVLRAQTTSAVIDELIERDVSSLLRKSYSDVFAKLSNRHGIPLNKFDDWPKFIECSQRRNLITHCDGRVNDEYLDKCAAAEAEISPEATLGAQLKVLPDYLAKAIDLLYEVGVMLAHTLWRVSREDHIGESDKVLTNEMYQLLRQEKWPLARAIGKFSLGLPLPKLRNDLYLKIMRLNYAQSLKWGGDEIRARKVLDDADWSATIRDLRLGLAVLREEYKDAAKFMREIGKKGELVNQDSYHQWPVFRLFRKTEEFSAAYKDVYGVDFAGNEPIRKKPQTVEASLADNGETDIIQKKEPAVPKPAKRKRSR